mmetsp:Transcript_7504/g.14661  ORF Transcript_7504/g.14661 Transcript_7504/m.14661 type:complete len:136 (-) Transcript_7504:139-546(-)
MQVDKVLLTEVLLQGAAASFINWAAPQILVAVLAVRQVLFEGNMNIMSVLKMKLNGLLCPQMAVAIGTVCHFTCFFFRPLVVDVLFDCLFQLFLRATYVIIKFAKTCHINTNALVTALFHFPVSPNEEELSLDRV